MWMRYLCLLCFRRVGHFLMPSDKHKGSHHRQVSNHVVHNRNTLVMLLRNTDNEQRGNVSYLTAEFENC